MEAVNIVFQLINSVAETLPGLGARRLQLGDFSYRRGVMCLGPVRLLECGPAKAGGCLSIVCVELRNHTTV